MRFEFPIRVVRFARIATIGLTLLVVADTSSAQSPFRLQKTREVALLGSGVALGVTSLVLLGNVDPLTIDEINALNPDDVNSFDRGAINPYESSHSGDVLTAISYLLPFTTFVRDDTKRDWHTIGIMWLEATALNLGINGVVKPTVRRTRPYVYDADTPLDKKTAESARLSFYSGHTTSTACNCFFMARVFSAYVESPKAKVAMWAGAATLPAITGFLRVDSGHHFRTDAIAGYVIGAGIGYFVPQLHAIADDRVSLHPVSVGGDPGVGMQIAF
jgi:membrane-associated phospholipid phosphatase